jgi:hypothetical protein
LLNWDGYDERRKYLEIGERFTQSAAFVYFARVNFKAAAEKEEECFD